MFSDLVMRVGSIVVLGGPEFGLSLRWKYERFGRETIGPKDSRLNVLVFLQAYSSTLSKDLKPWGMYAKKPSISLTPGLRDQKCGRLFHKDVL